MHVMHRSILALACAGRRERLKVEVFEVLVGALLALDSNGQEHVGVVVRGIASITHWLMRSSAGRWFSFSRR